MYTQCNRVVDNTVQIIGMIEAWIYCFYPGNFRGEVQVDPPGLVKVIGKACLSTSQESISTLKMEFRSVSVFFRCKGIYTAIFFFTIIAYKYGTSRKAYIKTSFYIVLILFINRNYIIGGECKANSSLCKYIFHFVDTQVNPFRPKQMPVL